jgi:hypothetical protein
MQNDSAASASHPDDAMISSFASPPSAMAGLSLWPPLVDVQAVWFDSQQNLMKTKTNQNVARLSRCSIATVFICPVLAPPERQ